LLVSKYRGRITRDLGSLSQMKTLAPAEFDVWNKLDGSVRKDGGEIPLKYRELIAIAVAHTTQCPYCIDIHTRGAKNAGASKTEVVEAILLAAALRSSAAVAHGSIALRTFDDA
jgi:AhpD family alkylhydroperoxidase